MADSGQSNALKVLATRLLQDSQELSQSAQAVSNPSKPCFSNPLVLEQQEDSYVIEDNVNTSSTSLRGVREWVFSPIDLSKETLYVLYSYTQYIS